MRANTGGGPFGYHPSYRKEEPEMTIPHHRPPERPATAGESGAGEPRELEARQPWPVTYDDAARRYGPGTIGARDAERELKQLLRGSAAEQDLLGLLTAAGGGLSGADLAELTGCSSWEIESCLAAVPGRTFTSRAGHWRPETVIYVLGHEELQQHALRFIGAQRLDEYRRQLRTWAELYRSRSWPKDTPEYLMRGYFRLLQTTGDVKQLLMLAADPARHDRMLDIIGGDTAALAEITAIEEIIASQDDPDLLAMSQLAVHRARLGERNDSTPANLPGAWARLGQLGRAEALARSIPDALRQVQALAVVVREVVARGDPGRADILTVQAERAISSVADPYQHAQALAVVARAAAEAGDSSRARMLLNRAEAEAQTLANSAMRAHVLVAITRAATAVGDVRRAKATANSIAEWSERAQAHASIATEVAKSGDFEQAKKIVRTISSRGERAQALAAIAVFVHATGDDNRSVDIATQAEAVARSIRNPARQSWALAIVAYALAKIGECSRAAIVVDSAERLAGSITKSSDQDETMTAIARVIASLLSRNLINGLLVDFSGPM